MHTNAFHHSLALIDYLAVIVPHVHMHDPALARIMCTAATAIPVHIAAAEPDRLARALTAALRVHVMLLVTQAWAYMPADDLAGAPRRLAKRRRGGPSAVTTMDTARQPSPARGASLRRPVAPAFASATLAGSASSGCPVSRTLPSGQPNSDRTTNRPGRRTLNKARTASRDDARLAAR
jgi:hypothetical protein